MHRLMATHVWIYIHVSVFQPASTGDLTREAIVMEGKMAWVSKGQDELQAASLSLCG